MHKKISLKAEILFRLIIPLIVFVALETVLSYFVTLHYVDATYDRWLLDSARSLTQEIAVKDARVLVELPAVALEIFKWDDLDKTFFKIVSTEQGLIAGDSFVPENADSKADWSRPVFYAAKVHGEPVRVVSMLVENKQSKDKIFIYVAETLNKRHEMMTDILLADLVPQIILVILVGVYLISALKRGLQPLHDLADQIAERSPRDLSPIAGAQVFLEVRTLTDTINGLLQRLAAAIAAQQRFIANAAHQLRTPLAGLKLQAERALREQDLPAMQPALMQMQNAADRVSHTISQLLVLARSEFIEGVQELRPVNLVSLAMETCMEWTPKALQRNLELSFESAAPELAVEGDEVLLRELLANLIDNAIVYGKDGGNILVTLSESPNPTLTVEDDGAGIPETEAEKVFERFYRIPGSPGNGCGLGLAIVKEIADLHKAGLELKRVNADGGTRINVFFAASLSS